MFAVLRSKEKFRLGILLSWLKIPDIETSITLFVSGMFPIHKSYNYQILKYLDFLGEATIKNRFLNNIPLHYPLHCIVLRFSMHPINLLSFSQTLWLSDPSWILRKSIPTILSVWRVCFHPRKCVEQILLWPEISTTW